mmetsp:Transcript_95596/g.276118  ORF Transcript_95596/g.276118 Transcript_95596/m.276118 type:complete len:241 (-) Transcript_95596:1016-1738(-)
MHPPQQDVRATPLHTYHACSLWRSEEGRCAPHTPVRTASLETRAIGRAMTGRVHPAERRAQAARDAERRAVGATQAVLVGALGSQASGDDAVLEHSVDHGGGDDLVPTAVRVATVQRLEQVLLQGEAHVHEVRSWQSADGFLHTSIEDHILLKEFLVNLQHHMLGARVFAEHDHCGLRAHCVYCVHEPLHVRPGDLGHVQLLRRMVGPKALVGAEARRSEVVGVVRQHNDLGVLHARSDG